MKSQSWRVLVIGFKFLIKGVGQFFHWLFWVSDSLKYDITWTKNGDVTGLIASSQWYWRSKSLQHVFDVCFNVNISGSKRLIQYSFSVKIMYYLRVSDSPFKKTLSIPLAFRSWWTFQAHNFMYQSTVIQLVKYALLKIRGVGIIYLNFPSGLGCK